MLATLDRLLASLEDAPGAPLPAGPGPLGPLCSLLAVGPEPRESLLRLRAALAALGDARVVWPQDGEGLRLLASVLSGGPEPGRILARAPARRLGLLLRQGALAPWSRQELARDLDASLEGVQGAGEELARGITAFRNDQFLRLAAAEFSGHPLEQVGRELSDVADLCLEAALGRVLDELSGRHGPPQVQDELGSRPCTLAVLALGKHGARELNFCSDIDVLFIYGSDQGSAGELSLHQFFTRVCQRVARLVGEPNEEGLCFRVDLRLRPEGNQGPICNSLAGAERYYETWGGAWDRLAWLKARPAAGDLDLGRSMLQVMRPFVFPRATDPEVIEQIQELLRRIRQQKRPGDDGWDVKLHEGGIRDVEFFVQALQLLHAGKLPALREPATLPVLDRLLFAGLVSEQEQRQLAEAYVLWRRIEHRLQVHGGRQTHLLPHRGRLREWLAAHMGLDGEALDREVARHRHAVRAILGSLDAGQPDPPDQQTPLLALLDGELPRAEASALLASTGFVEPERAAEALEQLTGRPWGPLGRSAPAAVARLARPLLFELSRTPDPDAALRHLVQLTLRVGPYHGFWQMLQQNLPTLRLLLSLFGSSDHLARHFVRHPELLDTLLQSGRATPRRAAQDLRAELRRRLDPLDAGDVEARLRELRRLRNEELLRVGLHDIAGELLLEQTLEQLSDLAGELVRQVFPLVWSETARRYGAPRGPDGSPASLAVLGLGKLGSRELTYASDLDLVFVYSGEGRSDGGRPVDNSEWFARFAQRFIRALSADLEEGHLYQVDTRLRPSGNQGALVTSLDAFREHHHGNAEVWQRQVLIKARAVAGDADLGREVERWVEAFVYPGEGGPAPAELRLEVRRMRRRLEQELAGEVPGFYNLKLGRGGMVDVDFAVQYLLLREGGRDPGLRLGSTLEALPALAGAGHLSPGAARDLEQGYRFLRRLESRLRIVRDRPAERLPDHAAGLEVMARRLGYRPDAGSSPGEQLLAHYHQQTRRIREVFDEVLGADE